MRFTCAIFYGAALLTLSACSGSGGTGAGEASTAIAPSALVADKLKETRALEKRTANRHIHGTYKSPQLRPKTPRDSGRKEALMFLTNVNFRTFGNIGFETERVVVAARPKNPADPVVLDDPQSFELHVLGGRVVVTPVALTELIDSHVFNFEGSPLRSMSVRTEPGKLIMSGQMNRRGEWVPFTMKGDLKIFDDATLAFTPTETLINGRSANALLRAANVDLDELITIKAPGVVLTKSTVYLNTEQMFPPPALNLNIEKVKLERRGLVLDIGSEIAPKFPKPLIARNSYIVIRGGDVKFVTAMPVNILMQIQSLDPNARLDFSLYDYRAQLEAGRVKFLPDGGMLVFLKNYNKMKLGQATQ